MNSNANILVSACLLGQHTRYDASHKYCDILQDSDFSAFNLVALCPEIEIGLGVPRTPINLYQRNNRIEVIIEDENKTDISKTMRDFCRSFIPGLQDYCGIVLKKNSPSCGIANVDLHHSDQRITKDGTGEFAYQIQRYLNQHNLDIPLVDESELADSAGKQQFLQRAHKIRNHLMKSAQLI